MHGASRHLPGSARAAADAPECDDLRGDTP